MCRGPAAHAQAVNRPERVTVYTTTACGACALKPRCTATRQRYVSRHLFDTALERLQQRIAAEPEAMKLRRATVEHAFEN